MPVGSLERAISARTAGVVRALGWIASIRPFLPSGALARGRRSARRTPRSPNAPDPNNVPQPDNYYPAKDGVEPWLNLRHAAALVGVAPRTLRLAAERGEIDALYPLGDGPWLFER